MRAIYWSARQRLGVRPDGHAETLARLRAAVARGRSSGGFLFPWGRLACRTLAPLLSQYEEIFVRRQYAFRTTSERPVIVDCGGNVGMSAIWFRQHYPGSELTVYEADPELAGLIARNLRSAGLDGVAVHARAVWTASTARRFAPTGDDRGALSASGALSVPAVDLARELPARVDLLKLDVEGAEYDILEHLCATGAIGRVQQLACEFHVTDGRMGDFLGCLERLHHLGFELAMTATLGPWLGASRDESPFEVVDRHQGFVQIFAWRRAKAG